MRAVYASEVSSDYGTGQAEFCAKSNDWWEALEEFENHEKS